MAEIEDIFSALGGVEASNTGANETVDNVIGEFLADQQMPFSTALLVPDPNQLSIPSEPIVRGDFTSRVPPTGSDEFSMAQFFANERTSEIGDEIVLSAILKQLESLPSATRNFSAESTFPGIDVFDFNLNERNVISRKNLDIGKNRIEQGI